MLHPCCRQRCTFANPARGRAIVMELVVGRVELRMSEQASRDMRAFAVHDRVQGAWRRSRNRASTRIPVASRALIRNLHESAVHTGPLARRPEAPSPRIPFRDAGQRLSRRPAGKNVPRSGLRRSAAETARLSAGSVFLRARIRSDEAGKTPRRKPVFRP